VSADGGRTNATGRHSGALRRRLALTYAGIALLTALVLGGILAVLLEIHFGRMDESRLQGAASRAAVNIRSESPAAYEQALRIVAYSTNTRLQALDASGRVLADSGPPQDIAAASLGLPEMTGGDRTGRLGIIAAPKADEQRSGKVVEVALADGPAGPAAIRASEGPSSAGDLMGSVAVAWALAALGAVLAAALAGFIVSSRVTRPIVALAEASDRMAAGNLATRVEHRGSDEIGWVADSFNQMAARVEATVATLQRFVSDAAHQLGTPLTALRADLELAQEIATGDEQRLVTRALGQEQRLEDLGAGLLELSRLESGQLKSVAGVVDLGALIREAADASASRAEQAGLALQVIAPPTGPRAGADGDRLRTAIDNLLDNAVKFTPAGGRVEIGAAAQADTALLWVADDGPGIAREDRGRVFERFYRGVATADAPGSGLGLAIVRAAVEGCGGTVRLADVKTGTRVEVRLPLSPG
jgi:signal transduction histidine kinase